MFKQKIKFLRTYTMRKITCLSAFVIGLTLQLAAQNSTTINPVPSDHSWEIGVHGGHFFSAGNVNFIPGYAGGIQIRRAMDYVFSWRLDLLYGAANGEDDGNVRNFTNDWISGSFQGIATLNNLKWNKGERKTNIYAFAGLGLNSFSVDLEEDGIKTIEIDSEVALHAEVGGGISFRINERFNVGIEHKSMAILGKRSDLLDGVQTFTLNEDDRSTFRDIMNYTSVRLNFNISKPESKTEPLYWLNPLELVLNDVQKLKDSRVTLNDEDGDGVIDMLDEEEDSPQNAIVDAKGVTKDSDSDGIADHIDKEPYSIAGYTINEEGVAQVPDVMDMVNKLLEEKLKDYTPKTEPVNPAPALSNWYLPAIYFKADARNIGLDEYGTLANLALVIDENPDLKLVVTGHTDEAGATDYNNQLSYDRAKVVINHLVEKHSVARSRLILQWRGEQDTLVKGEHYVNRRVTFKMANGETEMAAPKE